MLAWFVHGYTALNILTPTFILVLFIVSVLAAVWAIFTLISYHRTKHSAIFVACVDILFVGALIGGVVVLRGVAGENCRHFGSNLDDGFFISLGPFGSWGVRYNLGYAYHLNRTCSMLKACFALGIMNCFFFLVTAILALFIHRRNADYVTKETHARRHSHRRSGSRNSRGSRGSGRRRQYYV